MSAPRLFYLALVCLFALCAAPPSGARQAGPARTLVLTVTDKQGNHVAGLRREHFAVFDGERWQPPASVAGADAPVTVGIIYDASTSMSGKHWEGVLGVADVREGLRLFLTGSHPANEYLFIAFNAGPQLLLESTTDPPAVLETFDRASAAVRRGRTALYDALYLALDRAARGRHPKRVIVMITDGQDTASRYSSDQVRRAVAESDALVYALVAVNHRMENEGGETLYYAGRRLLEQLTSASGGRVFYAKGGREMAAAFDKLATELRSQYAVVPPPFAARKGDGWRELRVRVDGPRGGKGRAPGFKVRARPGFYDPARR